MAKKKAIKNIIEEVFNCSFGNTDNIIHKLIPISIIIITILFVLPNISILNSEIIQIISFLISCIYIICYYTLVIVLMSQYFIEDDGEKDKNMPKIARKAFDIAKYIFYNILSYFNKNIEEEKKQYPLNEEWVDAGAVLFFIFMVHAFFSLIPLTQWTQLKENTIKQ